MARNLYLFFLKEKITFGYQYSFTGHAAFDSPHNIILPQGNFNQISSSMFKNPSLCKLLLLGKKSMSKYVNNCHIKELW